MKLLLLKVWKPLPSLHLLYFLLRPFEDRICFWLFFFFLAPHYLVQWVAGVDTQAFLIGWMKELSSRVYVPVQHCFIDIDTIVQLLLSDPWPIRAWMLFPNISDTVSVIIHKLMAFSAPRITFSSLSNNYLGFDLWFGLPFLICLYLIHPIFSPGSLTRLAN